MQTDTPLQMMNSAVPATIQSAVEKRRTSWAKDGGFWALYTSPLVSTKSQYWRLLAENGCTYAPTSQTPRELE
jgi:hypothetical protein